MATIFPSLISADILNLQKSIKQLDPHCQGYHLDIMDDHFVPNLTWGPQFINAIANVTQRQLWVHLMVDNPHSWLDRLLLPPGSIISFHIEETKEKFHLINHIKEKKWRPSIAVKPKTAITDVYPYFDVIDHILLMSVEPGFSGQPFLPEVITKVDELRRYCQTAGLNITVGMDGGINQSNIGPLLQKDVDHIAVAAGIFHQDDPVAALKQLANMSA